MLFFCMQITCLALWKSLHCFRMKIWKSIKHEAISIAENMVRHKDKNKGRGRERKKDQRGWQERKKKEKQESTQERKEESPCFWWTADRWWHQQWCSCGVQRPGFAGVSLAGQCRSLSWVGSQPEWRTSIDSPWETRYSIRWKNALRLICVICC